MSDTPVPSRSRGLLLLTFANGVYIVGGYVLTVALARILGKPGFGSYGVVASFASVINMLITRGVPIATARGIAAHRQAAGDWVAASRMVMVPLSIGLTIAGIVAAWPLSSLLGDSSLRLPMQVGALMALTYGLQSQLFSWMYGIENYNRQAVGQMAYGLGRVVTIVGGAYLAGLTGAIAGFVIGPLIGALPLLTRRPASTSIEESRRIARTLVSSAVPIVVTATGVTLLMVVDTISFKSVATRADVGLYVAAATLAHIPYFLLQAASFVLLPSVAAAVSGAMLRAAVIKGVTDTLVLVSLPTAILMAVGDRTVTLIYGSSYAYSGSGLIVAPLALATAAVTMHAAFVSIDAAMHRLRGTVVVSLTAVAAMSVSVILAGADSNIAGAALAVAVVSVVLAFVHSAMVWRRVGGLIAQRGIAGFALSVLAAALVRLAPDSLGAIFGTSCVVGVLWLVLVFKLRIVDVRKSLTVENAAEPPTDVGTV